MEQIASLVDTHKRKIFLHEVLYNIINAWWRRKFVLLKTLVYAVPWSVMLFTHIYIVSHLATTWEIFCANKSKVNPSFCQYLPSLFLVDEFSLCLALWFFAPVLNSLFWSPSICVTKQKLWGKLPSSRSFYQVSGRKNIDQCRTAYKIMEGEEKEIFTLSH